MISGDSILLCVANLIASYPNSAYEQTNFESQQGTSVECRVIKYPISGHQCWKENLLPCVSSDQVDLKLMWDDGASFLHSGRIGWNRLEAIALFRTILWLLAFLKGSKSFSKTVYC